MVSKCGVVGEAGLQFYGKMCSSMSHEIKNALAIIQEHAGLLDDFTAMANEGMPINPQRVKTLAGKILGQVNRADGITKGLNRLAHSLDVPVKTVDVGELLTSLVTLSHRLVSVRGVTVEAKAPETTLKIETAPFFLQNLLWLCLDFAMEAAGEGKKVKIQPKQVPAGIAFSVMQLERLGDASLPVFPGKSEKALLEVVRAKVEIDIKSKEIVLTVPGDINE